MPELDFIDNYQILLLEESQTVQELLNNWLSEIPVTTVSSPEEIDAAFDATVAVACLDQSLLGEKEEEIRKKILYRNPFCQLALIVPRSSFLTPYEDAYDTCLQRPILQDEWKDTVTYRLHCGVYSALLREYYDLNAKFLWMRRADASERASVDVSIGRLEDRYQRLCSQLNQLQSELSDEDIKALSQSIDLHKRYLTEPARDVDEKETSKYHPRRCPDCKLAWGADHGNELGNGLVSIGAGVWKCTRCSKIVHGLGESGRRVM